jgi:hypothetical protein
LAPRRRREDFAEAFVVVFDLVLAVAVFDLVFAVTFVFATELREVPEE